MRRLCAEVFTLRLPLTQGVKLNRLLNEFRSDWRAAGRRPATATDYAKRLAPFLAEFPEPTATDAKRWVAEGPTPHIQRDRGKALRCFGKWAQAEGIEGYEWWPRIKQRTIPEAPQTTTTADQYAAVLERCQSPRDRAIVATLWATGMRRAELARIRIEELNLDEGYVIVAQSKTGRPRVAPLSPEAVKYLHKYLRARTVDEGPLWLGERGPLTDYGIQQLLQRLGSPSAHAYRRGWAVESLRRGVSQVSVQAAAGWNSGAMAARYTRALAGELSVEEFRRSYAKR